MPYENQLFRGLFLYFSPNFKIDLYPNYHFCMEKTTIDALFSIENVYLIKVMF